MAAQRAESPVAAAVLVATMVRVVPQVPQQAGL